MEEMLPIIMALDESDHLYSWHEHRWFHASVAWIMAFGLFVVAIVVSFSSGPTDAYYACGGAVAFALLALMASNDALRYLDEAIAVLEPFQPAEGANP